MAGSVSSYGREDGHVKNIVARKSSRVTQGQDRISVNAADAWLTWNEFWSAVENALH